MSGAPEECDAYSGAWCEWTEAFDFKGDLVPMIYQVHPCCPEHGDGPEAQA